MSRVLRKKASLSWRRLVFLSPLVLVAISCMLPVWAQTGLQVPVASPVDIVFSIDSSGSMGLPPENTPEEILDWYGRDVERKRVAAVRMSLARLDPDIHQVGLVSWDDQLDFTLPLTSIFSAVEKKLQNIDAKGGTNLKLGLGSALDLLEASQRPGAKRVVVFLTDGMPIDAEGQIDSERNIDEDLLKRARSLNATVYAIGLDVPEKGKAALEKTASETGGRFFAAPDAAVLEQVFLEILKEVSSDVFLKMSSQKKSITAGSDSDIGFSLSLVDNNDRPLLPREDIELSLHALVRRIATSPEEKSAIQQLAPQSVVIRKGALSASSTYTGLKESGVLEVSANSSKYPRLAARTLLPVQEPLPKGAIGKRPIHLRLLSDIESTPVGRSIVLSAVAVDNDGKPVPVDKEYEIIFKLRPETLEQSEAAVADNVLPGQGARLIPAAYAQPDIKHRRVDKPGEIITVSVGPLDLIARLAPGQSMFSFSLVSKEAWLFSVTLDSKLGHYAGERLFGAFATSRRPEGFSLRTHKTALLADGKDESRLNLTLIAKRSDSAKSEPVCGGNEELSINFTTSLGELDRSELRVSQGLCKALFPEVVTLKAGHRPGTATVRAAAQELKLLGMLSFDFIPVQPGWQLLVALVGGAIGALLKEYRRLNSHRDRIPYRALTGPFLLIGALVGLLFYIALYYGVRLVPTPVPFSTQPVFALLVGALGGFFGPAALELIASYYGLKAKKTES